MSSLASKLTSKAIAATSTGVKIFIKAKPGAKRPAVVSIDDEAIGIQVNAPPREGAANEALLEFVAEVVGVKRSKAILGAGGKSRAKVVEVETEQSKEEVFSKFTKAMED